MAEDESGLPVWARRGVSLGMCPKSYITAESEGMLETYAVMRRLEAWMWQRLRLAKWMGSRFWKMR